MAAIRMTVPHRVNLDAATPSLTKRVVVQIQNRGPRAVPIPSIASLGDLVRVTVESLGDGCQAPVAVLIPGSPNALPEGKKLKSKQKMNVFFEVNFDCANDPAKSTTADPGHDDFTYSAQVDLAALSGHADGHPVDDTCPREPLPTGRDPNPDGSIRDRGCRHWYKASGVLVPGGPTDVVVK